MAKKSQEQAGLFSKPRRLRRTYKLIKLRDLKSASGLRVHASTPTLKAEEAIFDHRFALSTLKTSTFDDDMAQCIAKSTSITKLEIGASTITAKGLRQLSKTQQLRDLDIWSTGTNMDCLQDLSDLEYLSVGSISWTKRFRRGSFVKGGSV
ncbi:MAG: hypothetical protein GY927_12755 [bacterium]|nr:hypothetical protein [bacterium]